MSLSRREFLEFLGISASAAFATQLSGCSSLEKWVSGSAFKALAPTDKDDLVLADGFSYRRLVSWGDKINSNGEIFGFNNDYLAVLPLKGSSSLLWVNHEYVDPLFVSGVPFGKDRTKKQMKNEMHSVGGSILEITQSGGEWALVPNSLYNRRITAFTKIPFSNGEKIQGSNVAVGTMANCAGGVTPWGTVLTCEENYDTFWGEARFDSLGKRHVDYTVAEWGWYKFEGRPPEHYGWVVEVDLSTGKAVKHTGIGRYAHECATTVISKSGELVVYSGDDAEDEHLYKFISDSPTSLKSGRLYVASLEQGRWLPLDRNADSKLKAKFQSQLDLLIRTREAAKIVGATPLDRPEDIEIHPQTGDVFVALTNNKSKGNLFGSLLKIREKDGDSSSLEFEHSTFLAGGKDTGFACPDNLAFDRKGDLWFTTDMSGSVMNKGEYRPFKNNSLFYVPMKGAGAGRAHRVASGPINSELTGPYFSQDGKTLFLSVQHPGERSTSLDQMLSHWPGGGDSMPRPSVVTISLPDFVL